MGMGRKRRRQESLWIATQELPRTKGHVFYDWVNRILEEHQFDAFAKSLCINFTRCGAGRECRRGCTSGCCWSTPARG